MRLQTCRRHPNAGRFLAECSGCKQDLFDIAEGNRARAAAPRALAVIGTPADVRIIDAVWVRGALVVTTEQAATNFAYAVDVFRRPTAAECDPEQVDPRTPGEWVLVDQYGADAVDEVPGMVATASAYLRELAARTA